MKISELNAISLLYETGCNVKLEFAGENMIALAIIVTVLAGTFGSSLGYDIFKLPEFGPVIAVAVMGGFIMAEIRKRGKK